MDAYEKGVRGGETGKFFQKKILTVRSSGGGVVSRAGA